MLLMALLGVTFGTLSMLAATVASFKAVGDGAEVRVLICTLTGETTLTLLRCTALVRQELFMGSVWGLLVHNAGIKMAPSVVLRSFSRLLAPARLPSCSSTRSKFYVREPVNAKPNWLAVGLSVGASVFMWIYLIQTHNEDVLEYKRRNGLE